MISSSLEGGE